MKEYQKEILKMAEKDTLPKLPKKFWKFQRWFSQEYFWEYLWNYYMEESKGRRPFYLPYLYLREEQDFLRRTGQMALEEIHLVIIDSEDERCGYLLQELLWKLNYLTILTNRKKYFEGLKNRAFQEMGLIIELYYPWQEKHVYGNLIWDLTDKLQPKDCYPSGSICFMPHKSQVQKEILGEQCPDTRFFLMPDILWRDQKLTANFAEALSVPCYFPFRESRCEDLKIKSRNCHWKLLWNP